MIPEINLLPKHEKTSSVIRIVAVTLLALMFFLMSLLAVQYFSVKSERQILEDREKILSLEKQTLTSRLERVMGGQSIGLEEAVSYAEGLTAPTSLVIDELLRLLPASSYLSTYKYDSNLVTIQTQFETLDLVAEYVKQLVFSPYFSDVKVRAIETFTFEGETDANFDVLPRYDVSIQLTVDRKALVSENGGEEDG